MKKNLCMGGVLFLTGLLFPWTGGYAQASSTEEAKEVIASGLGSIMLDDEAHARDDAIEDAMRKGVEQAIGLMIESETLVENFQLIEDNIFSKTRGYVQNYEVIKEEKRSEQLYEVTIRALVKMADLKSDLDAIATLIRRKNTPRMMVMINEKSIGETANAFHYIEADMNTTETALMEALMAKGFQFVDHATVKQNLDREMAVAVLEGDIKQAAAIGRKMGAEVILTGKALAKATVVEAFGAKTRSQQATVNVKAIRTDTGDIIATSSGQGAFPHIDDMVGSTKAIQRACKKLSENLIDQVLERWQSDVSSGAKITLKISGIADYEQLNTFKNALKYYVRGLNSVMQRDYSDGFATLDVNMTGSSDDLAQRLNGKNIEGIPVKVTGMTQNSVTVKLLRNE